MAPILTEREKVRKRKDWLQENNWSYRRMGAQFGMACGSAYLLANSQHARPERVEQLRSIGLPEELLPEARYTPPGPKPKQAAP